MGHAQLSSKALGKDKTNFDIFHKTPQRLNNCSLLVIWCLVRRGWKANVFRFQGFKNSQESET